MNSFAKSQGKEEIDWNIALRKPNPDWEHLIELAGSWSTCSVGQLSEFIPRSRADQPENRDLDDLGRKFTVAVADEDAEIALIYLKRVYDKGKEILIEQKKELNQKLKDLREEIASM